MWELFKENRWFFGLYFLFLITGGIWQIFWSPTAIFSLINGSYSTFSDAFFQYFTNVGDGAFFVLVIGALLFFEYRFVLIGIGSFALSSLLAQGLKRWVFADALRPKAIFEGSSYTPHWVMGVDIHSAHSFPSGHATTAFAIFCLLTLLAKDKRWGICWFVAALLAGYSRIYLGQHFFADTYFGSIIGVSSTVFMYFLLEHFFSRNPKDWSHKNILHLWD